MTKLLFDKLKFMHSIR